MSFRPWWVRRAKAVTASIVGVVIVVGMTVATAAPAGACGGLVGQNGTIQLLRTSTLAAYHDGIERYVTSFEFTGEGEEVGSIVPLPDVPSDVKRGGDWTLQRLAREVAPPARSSGGDASTAASSFDKAEVLLETEVDALDITVLRGGGKAVGTWALDNGFFLTPDAPEVLDFYAERSPIFMAAKFNASRAADLGQTAGQGTPIMVTIPTKAPWVPLRILALGLGKAQVVEADVFLLTDTKPQLLAGGQGLTFGRSESASTPLLDDLRSDVGMEWVPHKMWFSYLKLNAAAADLDYDLAISTDKHQLPSIKAAGVPLPEARVIEPPPPGLPRWPVPLGLAAGAVMLAVVHVRERRRHPNRPGGPTSAGWAS